MRRRTRSGVCHICGLKGPLSFEHVPPSSAFNDRPIVRLVGERGVTTLDSLSSARGPTNQRGAGDYTLCQRCNNDTGAWYASAYGDWAYQGIQLIEHAEKAPSLYHIFRMFPLRLIKQIFCMFFSRNRLDFCVAHQDLVRFVLNKDRKYADPSLRVFAYFNAAPMFRDSALLGQIDFNAGGSHIYSEVAFPPFGYILTPDGKSLDNRLADISFFSRYSYNEWTDVALRLPAFHLFTDIPGDFRSRDEVLKDVEGNRNEL